MRVKTKEQLAAAMHAAFLYEINPPTANQIKVMRSRAKLTQQEAARWVHRHWRTWSDWERGIASMDLAAWELFLIKCGLHE